jgi:enterochelin esterase-like enzyme
MSNHQKKNCCHCITTIFPSHYLKREVRIDYYLPSNHNKNSSLLFLFDGQDANNLQLQFTLEKLLVGQKINPLIVVAIHADKNRLLEYGIASKADYLKRGRKAKQNRLFVCLELLPYVQNFLQVQIKSYRTAIAGFSLGGLTAFDIAWHHSDIFGIAGVFSGSFWWRKKSYDNGYTDKDRIMHQIVRKTDAIPKLKCWIQTGTEDETADRNQNGIIDSIEDATDLITEMKNIGVPARNIKYLKISGGQHNHHTWSFALPMFLEWAFGRKKKVDIY